MSTQGTAAVSRLGAAAALVAIVLPASAFGFLLTTFLFAFSGGQYRMVKVVNIGALVVLSVLIVVAVATWLLRSPAQAIKWTAISTGVAWIAALMVEWLLSFSLGA